MKRKFEIYKNYKFLMIISLIKLGIRLYNCIFYLIIYIIFYLEKIIWLILNDFLISK